MVGFLEYTRALNYFDAYLERATKKDLEVVDELVKGRDELKFFVNLSRRHPHERTSLDPEVEVEGETEAHSLAWVMALARVELGALLAGFSGVQFPFEQSRPSHYERKAFDELLLDSTRAHYYALQNDKMSSYYWSMRNDTITRNDQRFGRPGVNEVQAIAYSRRVLVLHEFVTAVRRYGDGQLNEAQIAELDKWAEHLEQLSSVIHKKVLALGVLSSVSQQRTQIEQCLDNCPRIPSGR